MSTEERFLIFGHLTRQDRECRRNLAALDAKLKGVAENLVDIRLIGRASFCRG